MKTVSQNISREIDFLRELVRLYEQDSNMREREATIGAIDALERLLDVINHPQNGSPRDLPFAA